MLPAAAGAVLDKFLKPAGNGGLMTENTPPVHIFISMSC